MNRPIWPSARTAWAAGLLAGTATHLQLLISHGLFWDYGGGWPLATRLFWTSLTALDPVAALLLFLRPRAGALLTLAIMVSDVAHNGWALFSRGGAPWFLVLQAVFLGFVLGTLPSVWEAGAMGGGGVWRGGRLR